MKYAIKFACSGSASRAASVHLPEGAKGDMCRSVEDDVQFGRWFLTGPNPLMLRRCTDIPTDRFPVSNEMMSGLLDRTQCLAEEATVTRVLPSIYYTIFNITANITLLRRLQTSYGLDSVVIKWFASYLSGAGRSTCEH